MTGLDAEQELCNGGTLASLVESGALKHRSGAMLVHRVLTVLIDIALAMEHMHSQRIAHGDLNPSNILLQVRLPS